jgi:hypothetical protein
MNSPLQDILHREMSRKEFLAVAGLGLCSLLGIGSIVRLLSGKSFKNQASALGYNGGVYGGGSRTAK